MTHEIPKIDYKEKTLEYYNQNDEAFINGTLNVDFSETQEKFLSYLKPGDKILDFGCGSGRDTKYFLEKGFEVRAIDGSKKMCEFASQFTGINVKQLVFLDFDEKNQYNGIWACSSILHLNSIELLIVLKKIADALKPNGIFYTSFKYGTFEGERNGRFFNDMNETRFSELLEKISFLEVLENWVTEDVRTGHKNEKWFNVICKKLFLETFHLSIPNKKQPSSCEKITPIACKNE